MSSNKEKVILKSIKQSVEAGTPDVWDKVKTSEKYKYDFNERPLKAKVRNRFVPVMAAAALCAVVALSGMKMKLFELPRHSNEFIARGDGQNLGQEIMPSDSAEDSKGSASQLFDPFIKDADIKEASKAFGFNLFEPSWMPKGFEKVSAKLYSNDKDGKQPYMYNIEYKSGGKLFTITIMKDQYIPVDDSQAASSGAASSGAALPPDAPVQSNGNSNSTEPASPPKADKASDAPLEVPYVNGEGVSGSSAGSTEAAPGSEPVSGLITSDKIKDREVSITFADSSKKTVLSAAWIYKGGSYSICTDGVAKEDMVKIIESMIK